MTKNSELITVTIEINIFMIKKKSLGQYFLNSPKIIDDIVSAAKINGDDTVVEIGPGEGTLTSALLKTEACIVAVEKDDRLIPFLSEKFSKEISSGQLILIHGDILDNKSFSILDLAAIHKNGDTKKIGGKQKWDYKVVANIPYYITGQIIRLFLESEKQPESMTILIQKEVAERIVARDGKESLLSLSVKVYGEPKLVRDVGRGAFSPQPNVDSAVLNIENISRDKFFKNTLLKKGLPQGESLENLFFKTIHAGFAHKRKQLLPNLSSLYKKELLLEIFQKTGLDPKCRAEDLSIETWIKFCGQRVPTELNTS